jgi:hypothetical protein
MSEQTQRETIKVRGEELVHKVEELIHEGNVRKIVIKHQGHSVAEFPLNVGIIGVVLAPMLAAIGAIAAALNECTIEIERAPE